MGYFSIPASKSKVDLIKCALDNLRLYEQAYDVSNGDEYYDYLLSLALVNLSEAHPTKLRFRDELERICSILQQCPSYMSPGAGGQTIDAQLRRTYINKFPAIELERALNLLRGNYYED